MVLKFLMAVRAVALGAAIVATALPAAAQSFDRAQQRAWIQLGALRAHVDSLVRIDYRGDPELGLPATGTTLDFEDDLGLKSRQSVGNIVLGVRLWERGRLEFETYRLSRSATQTLLDEEVTIDGTTYAASATLDSRFDSRVQRLTLGYSFLKSPTAEMGLALGVQYTRYRLLFVGEGRINNEAPEVRSVEESDKGPLFTVGLFGNAALGSDWSTSGRVDYLPVNSRKINGYLGSFEINLHRRLGENVTLGLGYRTVAYKVNRKSTGEFGGRFEYRFRGPQVLLEAGF